MSYEYELLYQATKEAEYKSKLRIYVTTFILFFSIVLLLLIFSPVIYKYFFNPEEQQTIEEYVPEEQSSTGQENSETAVTPSDQNTTLAQETNVPPPPASNEQMTQEPPAAENKEPQKEIKTEQEPASRQNEPPATQNTTPNIQGVVKTGLGWIDEKNRVIYVQLENGKFTIQESAWESDERARKRISAVGTFNIPGMTGSVFKADLGPKGIWYRARFGEFTTIEEAKQKAEELRGKEKMKLQAFLFSILMVA
jgi:hypothetical protein